jgi:hypothetical protein
VNEPDPLERIRRVPSPLITRQLAAAGISPRELRLEHLAELPPIRPADLDLARLDDPVGELALGDAPRPVRLGSCERGDATILVAFTARDLARTAAYGARALAAAGLAPRMRVANTLEGGLATPGSLVLGDALEALGALDVPLGPVRDAKTAVTIAALVARIDAEILVVDPPSAVALGAALAGNRPASWRGIVWLGADGAPGKEPGWSRRWISLPEISVFFAVDCSVGRLHLDPDVRVEIREGRLRIGTLAGDRPLLAYEPGLRAAVLGDGCACGDPRRVLEPAAGI